VAVALGSASTAAADAPAADPVTVESGRLTLEVQDADLSQLLSEIARRAGFELFTSGALGSVTASFTGVPVDRALRRLIQGHETILVYRSDQQGSEPALAEVRVFAATAARGPADGGAREDQSGATAIAEINQVVRSRDVERGVARLGELLDAADPRVRARAAWGLGRLGGGGAVELLSRALRDDAVDVRIQAAQALGHAGGDQGVPALASTLQSDPDASVRRAVAVLLAASKDPVAASALLAATSDTDQSVRDEARRALERQRTAGQ
jgi:hypothetical protein